MLLKLGQIPTLVVSSADMAQEIMKTHDHIFASRPSLITSDILLYGGRDVAFAPYGAHWRQMRKLCVNHLLSNKMVQSFLLVREQVVESMITNISKISLSSGVVNMSEILSFYSTNVLINAISGECFREGRSRVVHELIEENIIILGQFNISDLFPSLGWLDGIFGMGARAKRVAKRWDNVLDEIIEEHTNRSNEMEDTDGQEEKTNFVNVLLALQKDSNMDFNINRDITKALLMDMIAAGIETSYVVLDWGMAELVRNTEAMKKLQEEVRAITKFESLVREEDLCKMSYLKAVIKEVLRLHTPVPLLLPRESMDHCKVKGYEVPKQTRVLVNAWSIGRDPKVWDAPEEFRPERFLDSHIDFRGHDFEFIPFGAGRRICPALQFAVSTLELALANLAHRFDWKLPDGMRSEDLDMSELPGLAAHRRQNLRLVAKPFLP